MPNGLLVRFLPHSIDRFAGDAAANSWFVFIQPFLQTSPSGVYESDAFA
jgi:hypothetical protein